MENKEKKETKKIDIEKFNQITEEDVGILLFMNDNLSGFNSVLKHRFSDFIVNEIGLDGKVVWIKDNQKVEDEKLKQDILQTSQKQEEDLDENKIAPIINENFTEFMNDEARQKLNNFIVDYIYKRHKVNDFFTFAYIDNKEKRKMFHEKIREHFPFLDTETLEPKETPSKSIKVSYMNKNNFYKRRKIFPDQNKKVLYFSMLKRNIDTVGALNYLARLIRRNPKALGFAGNKDKRGITTQRISIQNTLSKEVAGIVNSKKFNKNIEIGNYSFSDKDLKLGDLKGNQFCVTLRFIKMNDEKLDPCEYLPKIIESIQSNGFINYFGMQRFGTSKIPTHEIGKFVIQKKWKEAFIKILSTDEFLDAMRQLNLGDDINKGIFEKQDKNEHMKIINDLLKILRHSTTESRLLSIYKKNGINSFKNSFKGLNKPLQLLYPHAYQSYIWNMTVSYRLKKFGKKLIIGDIVKKHESLYQEQIQEENINGEFDEIVNDNKDATEDDGNKEHNDEEDIKNENENENNIQADNKSNNQKDNKKNKDSAKKSKEKSLKIFNDNFEYITDENISKFSFSDLVLPIVGYEICYPKNEITDYIKELLKKDELNFSDFEYQSVQFNSTGYFRKVIEKPISKMNFEILKFDDPDEDLQTPYYNIEPHPNPKGSKYTALRLVFQLPQSTYATMLFRELTKKSSAGTFQATLSKNIKEEKN